MKKLVSFALVLTLIMSLGVASLAAFTNPGKLIEEGIENEYWANPSQGADRVVILADMASAQTVVVTFSAVEASAGGAISLASANDPYSAANTKSYGNHDAEKDIDIVYDGNGGGTITLNAAQAYTGPINFNIECYWGSITVSSVKIDDVVFDVAADGTVTRAAATEDPADDPDPDPVTVDLGEFTISNGDNQKGWGTKGTDNLDVELTFEDVQNAKYLVFNLDKAPSGGLQFVYQSTVNGDFAWTQTDGILDNDGNAAIGVLSEDGKTLVIELSKTTDWDKVVAGEISDAAANAGQTEKLIKFLIGYYSPDIAGLGIVGAYLTDTNPLAAAPGDTTSDETGNTTAAAPVVTTADTATPGTGDNAAPIAVAILFALAITCAVVLKKRTVKE